MSRRTCQLKRANIKHKNSDVRHFDEPSLTLIERDSGSEVIIEIPMINEEVTKFKLNECTYIEDSSVPGSVETFEIPSRGEVITMILDNRKGTAVFDKIRERLRKRPVDQGKLKHFIDAINTQDVDTATRYAREFARDSATLELSLNSKNRNDTNAKNDSPKQEPLKLKLSIESFVNTENQESFDIIVQKKNTISDLKKLVHEQTQIPVENQFWFHEREHLQDRYCFGEGKPSLQNGSHLILYISKPNR